MKNERALLVVDYQNDFVKDDGKLTAGKPAQVIYNTIVQLVNDYDFGDVYFTFDNHTNNDWDNSTHVESKIFPKHCINGTDGWHLFKELKEQMYFLDEDGNKQWNTARAMYKRGYAISVEDAEYLIDTYNEIEIVGVVTDICVFQCAMMLYNHALNTNQTIKLIVNTKGCASFNQDREKLMIDYMKEVMGVEIK